MKKIICLIAIIALIFSFSACKKNSGGKSENENVSNDAAQSAEAAQPMEAVDDENETVDTYIVLSDDSTTIKGDGATFSEGKVKITKAGVYSLEGKLSDGAVIVNVDEEKKVKLLLAGVEIYSSDTAPIFIENSPKETKLVLMNGTVNEISDSADRTTDENNELYANAAVFSKDDLEILGSGTLKITANYGKGIFSKNDLQISSGAIEITAVDDAIRGKDSVSISGGALTLTCGGDGIRTNNEETAKGAVSISGGSISITSDLDGIQATGELSISDGAISIKTGGGSTENIKSSSPGSMFGGKGGPGNMGGESTVSGEESESTKALKADGNVSISGGKLDLDSYDDAVNTNESIIVSGGKVTISTNDDAFHSDSSIDVSDGEIIVNQSYEGFEGAGVSVSGGQLVLNASDDGINVSGSTDESSHFGGFGGDPSVSLEISGGKLFINANGDGIDSNGNIVITDGFVIIYGPTSGGDTAYDYGSSSTVSGGTVLAVGSSGMAEGIGSNVSYIYSDTDVSANTLITITDEDGNELISFVTPKNVENIIFYNESVKDGATYKILTGGTHSGEAANGVYGSGSVSDAKEAASVVASANPAGAGMGGPGGAPGGGPGGGPNG